ncbi:MAG: hypothetical protein ACKV2U_32875 [Bryobacteraceae bacterium]
MPEKTSFYLNALKGAGRKLASPGAGQWVSDGAARDFLNNYAGDIHLTGQLANLHAVHSVPSAFARPILFSQALANADHPLHAAARSEWRGLMAAIALKDWIGISVDFVKYTVPPIGKDDTSSVGSRGKDDLHLRTILRNQLPRPEADWETWWLIYIDKCLVGATSPWTVVYTPSNYSCPESIPWTTEVETTGGKKRRVLADPIEYFDPAKPRPSGKSVELGLWRAWTDIVLTFKDDRWGLPNTPHYNLHSATLAGALNDLKSDLNAYLSPFTNIKLSAEPFVKPVPYKNFLLPVLLGEGAGKDLSDLFIDSKKTENRKVLALSRSGLEPRDRVQGHVFADRLDWKRIQLSAGHGVAKMGGGAVDLDYVVVESAFFPPRLAQVDLSSGSAYALGSKNYALPLTPKFFEYFSVDDLVKKQIVQIEETSEQITATLRIPVRTIGGGSRFIKVQKTYRKNENAEVVPGDKALDPACALWPDFEDAAWHENYAACYWRAGSNVATSQDETLLSFSAITEAGKSLRPARQDESQRALRIWRNSSPLIGFSIQVRQPATAGTGNEWVDAGMAIRGAVHSLRKNPEKKVWTAGVDFGTSNTMVAVSENDNVRPLPMGGRLTVLSGQDKDNQYFGALKGSFFPPEPVTPPFRTLLYPSLVEDLSPDSEAGSANYELTLEFRVDGRDHPVKNIKWGRVEQSSGQAPMIAYLNGLVRLILAEAKRAEVTGLRLRWSYPLSLPKGTFSAMQAFWEGVATTATASTGIDVTVEEAVSESEAVCRCLASLTAQDFKARGRGFAVCIDIGGGSTDVAYWSEKVLKDQFSFKLAGNDVFDGEWLRYKNFDASLFSLCTGKDLSTYTAEERKLLAPNASAYINNLLWGAKSTEPGKPNTINPKNHPATLRLAGGLRGNAPWLQLRSLAYTFLSGISFYVGLHARRLTDGPAEFDIYLGGRGASLMTWVTPTVQEAMDVVKGAFVQGFQQPLESGSQLAAPTVNVLGPSIEFHAGLPVQKEEVARGLLSPALTKASENKGLKRGDVEKTIIGETEWAVSGPEGKPQKLSWDAAVTRDDLHRLLAPEDLHSSYIGAFQTYVLPLHPSLTLDIEGLKAVRIGRNDVENLLRTTAEEVDDVLQPVFAVELRALMRSYLRNLPLNRE